MADYEFLEQGGHARLVSDTKGYVDRANGVGTSQLADESVTMDKLADDVGDELDAIASDGAEYAGNVLKGTLAEAAVLTTDDAFAAPPESVEVYGKSTQASYTGKNLFDATTWINDGRIPSADTGALAPSTVSHRSELMQLDAGTYTYSLVNGYANGPKYVHAYDSNGTWLRSLVAINAGAVGTTFTASFTVTSDIAAICIVAQNADTNVQIEQGSTATDYEPYMGGKPAPNPDYPQDIDSVDDLTLVLCGKNLISLENLVGATVVTTGMSDVSTDGETVTFTATAATASYGGINSSGGHGPYNTGLGPFAKLQPNTQYTLSTSGDLSVATTVIQYRKADTYDTRYQAVYTANKTTFTTDADTYCANFRVHFDNLTVGKTYTFRIQVELGTTATTYEPYVGQSITIPLGNNSVRSLPDGTRDTLTLSYVGPSTREGCGVFGATLSKRVSEVDLGDLSWTEGRGSATSQEALKWIAGISDMSTTASSAMEKMCTAYECKATESVSAAIANGTLYKRQNQLQIMIRDDDYVGATGSAWIAHVTGVKFHYPLATPVTENLGTVELPILPNPMTAWADGGSAQPTLSMVYERDLTIVIDGLEQAIADIATS